MIVLGDTAKLINDAVLVLSPLLHREVCPSFKPAERVELIHIAFIILFLKTRSKPLHELINSSVQQPQTFVRRCRSGSEITIIDGVNFVMETLGAPLIRPDFVQAPLVALYIVKTGL